MKSLALLIALASCAAAQEIEGLPICAQTCLNDFMSGSQIAGCSRLDVPCICSNESFLNSIACCLVDACDEAAQQDALDYAVGLCNANGVSVPSTIVCSTAATTSEGADPTTTDSGSDPTETAEGQDDTTTTESPNAGPTATTGFGGVAAGLLAAAALL